MLRNLGLSLSLLLSTIPSLAQKPDLAYPIRVLPLGGTQQYPNGAAPDSLWLACASVRSTLVAAFRDRGLTYDRHLERHSANEICHVWYEPTILDFRAHSDDAPAKELLIDISLLSFVTQRPDLLGDSYDVASFLLPQLQTPVRVTLGLAQQLKPEHYELGLATRFSIPRHTFRFRRKAWESYNPWTQDYLKSGQTGGETRILVSRRNYEVRPNTISRFAALEDQFEDPRFVRSKLAWEGGDLQFLPALDGSGKLTLIYGEAAAKYWATSLTPAEYAYILKEEFGADEVWNASGIAAHVDYAVLPVAAVKTLLIGQPVSQNLQLAREAFDILNDYFIVDASPPLQRLQKLLASPANPLVTNPALLRAAIERAKSTRLEWPIGMDTGLLERVTTYTSRNCPGKPKDCLTPERVEQLLRDDRLFLQRWAAAATRAEDYEFIGQAILALIESQLPGPVRPEHKRLDALALQAEKAGWRVVRVPLIGFESYLKANWTGISYANVFATGSQIFVPNFGLPGFETELEARLSAEFPGFRISPIFARHGLLHGGGIHCVLGIVRQP